MIGRLFLAGLALGAWGLAARRWGGRRPSSWRLSFGALGGLCAAFILLPGTLDIEVPRLVPEGRELGAAGAAALLGALWARSSSWDDGALRRWAETFSAAALTAAFVMRFVVQPFRIPTGSMEDTLRAGDRVLVNRLPWAAAERGGVLAFIFPVDDPEEVHCTGPQAGRGYLKRVIGMPGDVVELRDAVLHVNGAPAGPEPYVKDLDPRPCAAPPAVLTPEQYQRAWEAHRLDMEQGDGLRDHFGPVAVPEKAYLVLGDNRDASCDSRFWGPVPERYVLGTAFLVYWPPSRMGRIR